MNRKRYRFEAGKTTDPDETPTATGAERSAKTVLRSLVKQLLPPQGKPQRKHRQRDASKASGLEGKYSPSRRKRDGDGDAASRVERAYAAMQRRLQAAQKSSKRKAGRLPVRDPISGTWLVPGKDSVSERGATSNGHPQTVRLVRPGARLRSPTQEAAESPQHTAPMHNVIRRASDSPQRDTLQADRDHKDDMHTTEADASDEAIDVCPETRRAFGRDAASAFETLAPKQHSFIVLIAGTCAAIAENPEQETGKLQSLPSLLRELDRFQRAVRSSPSGTACSAHATLLCIRSLTELFLDICPGYQIRIPSEPKDGVRLSKTVRKLRKYESVLLQAYASFIRWLRKHLEGAGRCPDTAHSAVDGMLRQTCLRSCQELLLQLCHFNHAEDLVEMLVSQFGTDAATDEVLVATASELMELFESSTGSSLRTAVRLVRALCRRLRDEGIRAPAAIVEPLLKVPLEALHAAPKKKRHQQHADGGNTAHPLSRRKKARMQHGALRQWMEEKQRLDRQVDEQLSRDIHDLEAESTPEEMNWARRQVMAALSQAYAQCLLQLEQALQSQTNTGDTAIPPGKNERSRSPGGKVTPQTQLRDRRARLKRLNILLPRIAEGLGQIALYLNAKLLNDLLLTMYRIIDAAFAADTEAQSLLGLLRCVRAAYQIIIAQQIATQNADPTYLDGILFRCMNPTGVVVKLPPDCRASWHRELTAAVDFGLLGSRRTLPIRRGAAFWMRLLECALHATDTSWACLYVRKAESLVERYPVLRTWLASAMTVEETDTNTDTDRTILAAPIGLLPSTPRALSDHHWDALAADPDIVGAMLLADQAVMAIDAHGTRVRVRDLCAAPALGPHTQRGAASIVQALLQRLRAPLPAI